jgi:hypothetical protein
MVRTPIDLTASAERTARNGSAERRELFDHIELFYNRRVGTRPSITTERPDDCRHA